MKARIALSLALVGLVSAGIVLLGRSAGLGEREHARPPEAPAPDAARLERLEEELARLRRAVDELAGELRTSRSEVAARVPRGASPAGEGLTRAELQSELRALENRLASELRAAADDRPSPSPTAEILERIKAPGASPDWAAWQPVIDLWNQDRDAARREVKLLCAEQVLERFGAPTDVWSNTNGITWQYARDLDPVLRTHGLEILLRIPDGYVTQLVIR